MANIETVDFGAHGKMQMANVSTVVGQGLAADKDDVMLIQALMWLAGRYGDVFSRHFFGVDRQEMSDIDGILGRRTVNAIWTFQRTQRRYLVSHADGKIHPAKYENRVINIAGNAPLMMITFLNFCAIRASRIRDLSWSVRQVAPYINWK